MMKDPVRCAIVGCGAVADEYVRTLEGSALVDVVACVDVDMERARAFAARHRVPHALGLDETLEEGYAELLIVLTPPGTHIAVAQAAVRSGTSVYVEKPLALTGDDAAGLLTLADRHQVLVGGAPDTYLAPPAASALTAIAQGRIGKPTAASAALLTAGPERWHPEPEGFYEPDLGPLADMGPYYLSQLVHLLGSIAQVDAATGTTVARRTIRSGNRAGQVFRTKAFTHVEAVLRSAAGVTIALTVSSDVQASTRPHLEIYGSEGTLVLPDPNFHQGTVRIRCRDQSGWTDLPTGAERSGHPVGRGMGVLELAAALRTAEPHRTTGCQALHVCRILDAIREAAVTGASVQVTLDRPSVSTRRAAP
ncbi:Gfo/Idh/MocA family protein [Actinomadura monticuli]|uniref:Gfo/Idh/MocA family oxidoreductase n=1 Tax=Actinomadura monticuli TaxID=3097367 RepID=A0ABV4QMF2_9ACTN